MDTTFAMILKERIANMPDDINDIKELEAYIKQTMKDIKEENKKKKAEEAEKKKNEKKKKRDNVAEDGNEKPKRRQNQYREFMKENRIKIKEQFPQLSPAEIREKLAEEWEKHKLIFGNYCGY